MFKSLTGKIAENLFILGNIYYPSFLIKGKHSFIIDTGISITGVSIYNDLTKYLNSPYDLEAILLTHSHFDHAGSAPYLKRKIPLVKILASPVASEVFKKTKAVELIRSLNKDFEEKMNWSENVYFDKLEVDKELNEGDVINVDENTYIEVIETPGHTRCSLSYYIPSLKAIFIGEAGCVPNLAGELIPEFLTSYSDYINSLKKLMKYDVSIIVLAHGGIYTDSDAKNYFENCLLACYSFRELVEKYLDNYSIEETIEKLGKEIYSKGTIAQPQKPFLINFEHKVKAIAKERR